MLYRVHSEKVINKELSKLKPLKYNPYYWWRSYKPKVSPLSKKSSLIQKIRNGDLDFSHYFWQIQKTEHQLNQQRKESIDYHHFIESSRLNKERRKRLIDDFIKDENEKLEQIEKLFIKEFNLTKDQYYKLIEEFEGTLEEFYIYLYEKIR